MVNVPLRCTSGDEAPGHGLTDAIPLLSPFGLAAIRRPADKRSRPQRWRDAVAELLTLQDDYRAWLDTLPPSLENSATAEALRSICDLDLSDLEQIEPPRGFGRDG